MAMNAPNQLPPFLQALVNSNPNGQIQNNPDILRLINALRSQSGSTGQPTPIGMTSSPMPMGSPLPSPVASNPTNDFAKKLATGMTGGLFDINQVWNAANAGDVEASRAAQQIDPGIIEILMQRIQQAMSNGQRPMPPQGGPPSQ